MMTVINRSIDTCLQLLFGVMSLFYSVIPCIIDQTCMFIQSIVDVCVYGTVKHSCMCFAMIILTRILPLWLHLMLLLSGDIETNPGPVCTKCLANVCICEQPPSKPKRRGPSKQCPACASFIGCRKTICNCGYDFIKCVVVDIDLCKANNRKTSNRNSMARSRANETHQQTSRR